MEDNKDIKWERGDLNTIISKIAYYSGMVDYQQRLSVVYIKLMVWHPFTWVLFCIGTLMFGLPEMLNRDDYDWRFRNQNGR